jgi:hypothetical protein
MRFQLVFAVIVAASLVTHGAGAQHQEVTDDGVAMAELQAAQRRLVDHPNCAECVSEYESALARYEAAIFAAQNSAHSQNVLQNRASAAGIVPMKSARGTALPSARASAPLAVTREPSEIA